MPRGWSISVFLDWADFTLWNARSRRLACREERPSSDRRRTRERKVHSSAAPLSSAAGQRTRARRVQPHQRRRRHMDALLPCIHARRAAPCRIENTVSDPQTHENACRLVYLAGGIYVRRGHAAATTNVPLYCLTRGSRLLELRIINNQHWYPTKFVHLQKRGLKEATNEVSRAVAGRAILSNNVGHSWRNLLISVQQVAGMHIASSA